MEVVGVVASRAVVDVVAHDGEAGACRTTGRTRTRQCRSARGQRAAGGVAAKWAALGHKFKCVAVTNGDIGHSVQAGGALARRRRAEVERAGRILGIETEVLDNHDGELMVTLENRRTITSTYDPRQLQIGLKLHF